MFLNNHKKTALTTPSMTNEELELNISSSGSENDTYLNTVFPFVQSEQPLYFTNVTDNSSDSNNISSTFPLTYITSSADMPASVQPSYNSFCIRLHSLGRFSHAVRDFDSMFISPNRFNFPLHKNSLYVPDDNVLITDFQLWSELDSGGTLKMELYLADKKVYICMLLFTDWIWTI